MPTVEQLQVAYESTVAQRAQQDAQALNALASALDTQDQRLTRTTKSWQAYIASLDPAVAAQRKVTAAEADAQRQRAALNAEYAKGSATAADLASGEALIAARLAQRTDAAQAALERAQQQRKSNDDLKDSTDKVRYAMRDLGIQSIDVFQGLASGQPVFRTLIQQGAQIAQVNASAGVSYAALGRSIASLAVAYAPLIAVVAGGAAIIALGAAAETSARQLNTLQNQLRATRDDYVAMASEVTAAAKAIAATTGIGTGDARTAAATIAASANFTGTQAQLESLVKTAGDLATVMGESVPDAAKRLAAALQDPGAEAQKLADQHFPGMNQALAYSIKLQADAGDKAGAFARELKVLQDGTKGANDNLTPLQLAVRDLSDAFTKTGQDGKSLAEVLGGAFTSIAAGGIEAIARLINAIRDARDWIGTHFGLSGGLPGASAGSTSSIVVAPSSQLQTSVSNQIYAIAEKANFGGSAQLSALQADFATRVAYQESRGNQSLISSAGAIGTMGIMPKTAAGLGYSQQSVTESASTNIEAGLKYIAQLWSKYGGNPALVAMAYNWGPGNVDAFLAGQKAIGQVPGETASYVKSIAGVDIASLAPGGAGGAALAAPNAAGAGNAGAANDAFKLYLSSGVLSVQRAQNQAQQASLQQGISVAQSVGDVDTVNKLSEALAKLRGEQTDLITEQQKLARSSIDATEALSKQSGFDRDMAAIEQQFAAAARSSGQAIDQKSLALAKAAAQVKLSTEFTDEIAATDRATNAQLRISAAYDGTAASLSRAQNYEKAYALALQKYSSEDGPQFTEAVERYSAALDRGSDAMRQFEQQQASVSALSSAFSNAFDTIGNAITQAFVQGQGAAVSWGNIIKSVVAQVIQQLARLAIINPILNSLFGQNNGTLGTAIATLGNGSSAGGIASGGGLLSGLGSLSSLSDIGKVFSSFGSGGTLSASLDTLGATYLPSIFSTPTNSALAAMGGAFGPATAAQVSAASSAGGLGAAFSSFSNVLGIGGALLPGIMSGNYGQAALGGLGAAGGLAAGTALGGVLGSWAGPAGIAIGGVLGNVLGGVFGGPKKNAYSSTKVGLSDGQISVGGTLSQLVDASGEVAALRSQVSDINAFLSTYGIQVAGQQGAIQIGQNTPGGYQDPSKFADLYTPNQTGSSAFSLYRFGNSPNSGINRVLDNQSFSSLQDLENAVNAFNDARAAIDDMVASAKAATDSFGKTGGSLASQIAAIDAQYNAQISSAESLKSSIAATSDDIDALSRAESDLASVREQAKQAAIDALAAETGQKDIGFTARYLSAYASVTGSASDAVNAQLYAFDTSADQQRKDLSDWLVGIYGDSFKQSSAYADQMATLEHALGEERLAIQTQYWKQLDQQNKQASDAAAKSAAGVVSSITDYVLKLQNGSASPLSPNDQYALASSQFNAVAGAARAGDFASQQSLTTYADAFLAASRTVNGSGIGYATDYGKVLDVLQSIAGQSADQLTASAMAAQLQSQTDTLSSNQTKAIDLLQSILLQLRQAATRPASAAA